MGEKRYSLRIKNIDIAAAPEQIANTVKNVVQWAFKKAYMMEYMEEENFTREKEQP